MKNRFTQNKYFTNLGSNLLYINNYQNEKDDFEFHPENKIILDFLKVK